MTTINFIAILSQMSKEGLRQQVPQEESKIARLTQEERKGIEFGVESYLGDPKKNSLEDFTKFVGDVLKVYPSVVENGDVWHESSATKRHTVMSMMDNDGTFIDLSQEVRRHGVTHNTETGMNLNKDGYKETLSMLVSPQAEEVQLRVCPMPSTPQTHLGINSNIMGVRNLKIAQAGMSVVLEPKAPQTLELIKDYAQKVWGAYKNTMQAAKHPQPPTPKP